MKLNNKGFTLVELLTVIVIIGIVLTIVVPSVVDNISDSKDNAEKVFINRLNDVIDTYIDQNRRNFVIDSGVSPITIEKSISPNEDIEQVKIKAYKMKLKDGSDVKFSNIINNGMIRENEFVNPKNDNKCAANKVINIYRDEDFVYYYDYDLSESCGIKYYSYPVEQEGEILGDEVFEAEETEEE